MLPDTFFSHDGLIQQLLHQANEATANKDFQTAEDCYKKALDGLLETFGPGHIQVAMVMHNLSAMLEKQGRLDEAQLLGRKVTHIITQAHKHDQNQANGG